jgi:phenylpropionate dioxygenase-like ring-hydroxylating dioxygenase large terminal subunit
MSILNGHSAPEAVEEGHSLPHRWYADPWVFERELELLLRTSWHYACAAADVARPGDFKSYTFAGVPLVVVRDKQGRLHAFVNVCRHRAHEVVSDCGNRGTLQCPYHLWTWNLDGSLRSAPRAQTEPGFDPDEFPLVQASIRQAGPLIFVAVARDAEPIEAELGAEISILADIGLSLDGLVVHRRTRWEMAANWKVALENYLECYHCPSIHRSFSRFMSLKYDGQDLLPEVHGRLLVGRQPRREGAPSLPADLPYAMEGPVKEAHFTALWPVTTFSVWPGPPNLQVGTWLPLSHDKVARMTDWYFGPEVSSAARERLCSFIDEVGQEDIDVVASVQRGLAAGATPTGRLFGDEPLVGAFQRLVAQAIS